MRDFHLAQSTRRSAILLGGLLLAALFLLLLDSRGLFTAPRRLATTLIDPAAAQLSSLGERVRGDGPSDSELQRQLDAVTDERDELMRENELLRAEASRVEELENLLNLQQQTDLAIVNADVILSDPQSRDKFLIINKGSDDGLYVGLPVLSPNFLVGYIDEVEPNRARILLVIDQTFQTGARIRDAQDDGAEGIVYGEWQLGGRAVMRHVARDLEIPDQAIVVTSGKSLGIPEGLIIGTVQSYERNDLRNEMELQIVPQVDFDDLSTVAVILPNSTDQNTPVEPPPGTTPTAEETPTP